MNLYELHMEPAKLYGHEQLKYIPMFAWGEVLSRTQGREPNDLTGEELRAVVAKDPETAYNYANRVEHGRWEQGEDAIATSAQYSYYYASRVLGGRFEQGEDAIIDTHWAYDYAYVILQRRWLEAEKYIKQNENDWNAYKQAFRMKS